MLQHRCVGAWTRGTEDQRLSRLTEGERTLVLHREVCRHDPVDVITERPRFGFSTFLRTCPIVGASFPQRKDIVVGQIHIVGLVHGGGLLCPWTQSDPADKQRGTWISI